MGSQTPIWRRGGLFRYIGLAPADYPNDPADATTLPEAGHLNLDVGAGVPATLGQQGSYFGRTDGTLGAGTWAYFRVAGAWQSFAAVVSAVVGGVAQAVSDSLFTIYDNADPAKILAFECSQITGGNTRTITMADVNVDLRREVEYRGVPAMGTIRVNANPADTETLTVTVGVVGPIVFEFDNNATVTPGNITVTIGATPALTAVALQAALAGQFPSSTWTVHATDDTVIDARHVTSLGGSGGFAFVDGTAGDLVLQDRASELAQDRGVTFGISIAVSAEDVTVGHLLVHTGLSAIRFFDFSIKTSSTDATPVNYDGAVSVTGGTIQFEDAGIVDLAAGHVLRVWGIGIA